MEINVQDQNPRQRIVSTAMRLFFTQGYLATGINQIIGEADVCKATFYSNFPSKDDLCVEYIKESHEQWMVLLQKEINKQKKAYEQLMSVFIFLENWMGGCSYRGCGLMNISSEVPEVKGRIRRVIQERNEKLKETITQLIAALKRSDQRYENIEVQEVSSFMLMIIQGAVALSQANVSVEPIRQAKKSFKRFLDSFVVEFKN